MCWSSNGWSGRGRQERTVVDGAPGEDRLRSFNLAAGESRVSPLPSPIFPKSPPVPPYNCDRVLRLLEPVANNGRVLSNGRLPSNTRNRTSTQGKRERGKSGGKAERRGGRRYRDRTLRPPGWRRGIAPLG